MIEIFFVTDFPPSVNNYYAHTKNGIFIKSKGVSFRKIVEEHAREHGILMMGLNDKLKIRVILYPPDARNRDLDNYMKGLLDAITHAGIWEDDKIIDQVEIVRGEIIKSGRTVVMIKEADDVLNKSFERLSFNDFMEN